MSGIIVSVVRFSRQETYILLSKLDSANLVDEADKWLWSIEDPNYFFIGNSRTSESV
jgi:hypothetical protein